LSFRWLISAHTPKWCF